MGTVGVILGVSLWKMHQYRFCSRLFASVLRPFGPVCLGFFFQHLLDVPMGYRAFNPLGVAYREAPRNALDSELSLIFSTSNVLVA